MDLPNYAPLMERLGYTFKDESILIQAITHRSYINEHADFPYPHNERLEFLGDAVLELVVTEHLQPDARQAHGSHLVFQGAQCP